MFADPRPLAQLRRALAEGKTSSEELTRVALARAAAPGNVFTQVFAESALAEARAADLRRAAGVPVGFIWTGFLILASVVLTVNFQTVGGLMIYSLITNPAVAAFQLARGHDRTLALAVTLGGLTSLAGFLLAALVDLPTGATIVVLSSLVVGVAALIRHFGSGRA